jgi:Tfp pilus assembly protein PilZ
MDPSKPSSTSEQVLLARCETWREFVERYANDIGSGGMFVETELSPEALSTLEVRLQLPETADIVMRGRVVHVLSPAQASLQGKASGVGLELLDMDAERKKQIQLLIEFARQQGLSNDPNASFARTLLEISAPLAAAEVGHRLSQLPGAGPRSGDSSSGIKPTSSSSSSTKQTSGGKPTAASSTTLKVTGVSSDTLKRTSDSASAMKRGDSANIAPRTAESSTEIKAQAAGAGPPKRADSQDLSEARAASVSNTNLKAANDPNAAPVSPPKPTDKVKLKLALTEFAHKHYEAALRITREMLESNPGDPQALRWQHMCHARLALMRNDTTGAVDHYDAALSYDEDNREAREYVRNIRRDKKLNSLPFGRYFTKKK